jgi:hypothetical protein
MKNDKKTRTNEQREKKTRDNDDTLKYSQGQNVTKKMNGTDQLYTKNSLADKITKQKKPVRQTDKDDTNEQDRDNKRVIKQRLRVD